ncbi:MAG: hypothetical protein JST16_12395 [Bdellovibrionales bacterium]|nr:hypothetical protein [Bdellovibrionales bacterium]
MIDSLRALSMLSGSVYKAAEFADAWIGLPGKASESIHFRQDWRRCLPAGRRPTQPTVWIHGASVGELEDLAAFFLNPSLLKFANLDAARIVLTASSISAKERLAKWADTGLAYAGPLPPESPREMRSFLHILMPDILVLSHTDLWPVALQESRENLEKGCLWIPSHVPSSRTLIDPLLLNGFIRGIACRSEGDQQALSALPSEARVQWLGNLRVDRILERIQVAHAKSEHALEKLGGAPQKDRVSLIVGSCWLEDAQALASALRTLGSAAAQLQIVVIPHETRDTHLVAAIKGTLPQARVLSVQGVLAESYRDFSLALVGGGFRTGLHNILEPLLWGVPVVTGPHTRKQPEAPQLAQMGALRIAHQNMDLVDMIKKIIDPHARPALQHHAELAAIELRKHAGAAQRFAQLLREMRA